MPTFDRYRRLPLRAKLAACVTLGAFVLVVALVSASIWMLRDDLSRTASDGQAALIEGIAHDLDEKIAYRVHALELQSAVLGHRVPMDTDGHARSAALDDFFASRPLLESLFNGLLLVDAHGRIVHDAPHEQGRIGLDISDRDHIRRVLHDGAPVIAEPLPSGLTGRPVINMAVPVRDDRGETVGALIGQLGLEDVNFISDIGRRREGRAGHFVLLGQGDVVIAHPDRTQLMHRMPPGASAGLSAARHGASAATLARDATGEELLSSDRLLTAAPWVIQAVYPTSEAYALLRSRERTVLGSGGAAALVAGLLMWSMTSRLLRPLDDLRRAMSDDEGAADAADLLRADSADLAALLDAHRLQTQRRRDAEVLAAQSERRLRDIADNIPALIAFVDRDETYRYANRQYIQYFETNPQDLLGRTLRDTFGDAFHAARSHQVRAALEGKPQQFELPYAGRNLDEYVRIDYVPAFDANGVVDGFYVMALDITEQKQAEHRVALSERRVRAIADNIPGIVAYYDRDERITFVNARVGELHGMAPEAIVGMTMRELRGEAVYALIRPHAARVLSGEPVTYEVDGPVGDEVHHYVSTYLPDIGVDGTVRGFYAFALDITERKQAELARLASERRLQDVIDTIPAMVCYFDMSQRCQFANDTAVRSLGIERAEVPGISMRTALGETVWAQHASHLGDVLDGARARFEGKVPFPNREAHYQAHLIPDRDASDNQLGYYLMTFDITALKEAQHRQARVEAQLRSVTDNLPVLISYVDRDRRFTFMNETFNAWMGIDPVAVLGRHVREVIGDVMYAEREAHFERVFAGDRVEFEVASTTQSGLRHLQTVYVPDLESDGTVVGAYCLSTDVTAMKNAERQLSLLVRSDALTGLANRYRFNEALPESLARVRRSGLALALMFLDIDRFKQINDQLGHGVGDEALQEFAARLQRSVRLTDLVARLAGDEFVIILEGLHAESEAQAIARKILAEINRPFALSSGPLAVTTSLGIAYRPDSRVGEDDLLARADEALYQAKAAGRNTYRLLVAA